MNVDLEKGTITIYGKAIKIDALVKKISTFSGQQLSGFLDSRNIKLARAMNIIALRTALNDKIKFLHSKSFVSAVIVLLVVSDSATIAVPVVP